MTRKNKKKRKLLKYKAKTKNTSGKNVHLFHPETIEMYKLITGIHFAILPMYYLINETNK